MKNKFYHNLNRNYCLLIILIIINLFLENNSFSQKISYSDNWGNEGFYLAKENIAGVKVNYSIHEFTFENIEIKGEAMKKPMLPGHFLPNDEGAPDLPGKGRYIALPQGAKAVLNITASHTETISNIDISPAPRIPLDTENGPLAYNKSINIYSKNTFYPANPVAISSPTKIRGVDVVMLGITPFQYNPVTKELIIYRDLKIEISFEDGNGHFGDDRLRSRWFDPILSDAILNYSSLPKINYEERSLNNKNRDGCEYLIVSPDGAEFQQWADSIKNFRTRQGILTDVVTLTEIGGNTATLLENYFNNAYNTWTIPPVAVLLLGDFGSSMTDRIISPIWDYYCASDNIYADVTNNSMPDIVFARITARDAAELEVMITKFINFERTPPTNPDFYYHPITALGWQTERWFQICTESIGGFWKNELGKDPVRINEIYVGNPSTDPWSTAQNTYMVVNYFGPSGLGYIPASPSSLGGWSGGTAADINNAINNGAFILQHRDHGGETGWGEPSYHNSDINGLTNTDLTFVLSINCLTGKFNSSQECFAEKFHRHTTYSGDNAGALGLIAASEVSYSFVNDTYVWGVYDNMWPEFMPDYSTTPDSRGLLPAFGNSGGKYFLQQSGWPYNTGNKEVTYNLFHCHGDAFLNLYSEVPQDLTVVHNTVLLGGIDYFTVQADEGSFIALTNNGEILATADGTGAPLNIAIAPQLPGDTVIVTITKQNYFRYCAYVVVIPPDNAYCTYNSHLINDQSGNADSLMDYAETILLSLYIKNLGLEDANNVDVTLSTNDLFITVTDSTENYGTILSQEIVTVTDGFCFDVANNIPDLHSVIFNVVATDGTDIWESSFAIEAHAPILEYADYEISDPTGNNNGRIDPGETVDLIITISNSGSSEAYNVIGELICEDQYITLNENINSYGNMTGYGSVESSYSITAEENTPGGYTADFNFEITADAGLSSADTFGIIVGQYTAIILDLDPNNNSAPAMQTIFDEMDLIVEYSTEFPDTLILYKSVFLCLGIYYSNYILSDEEGQLLTDYLNDGGNLYMEGRTTWFDDPQTPVHSMFNLTTVSDNWFEFENIFGQTGTFTEGMNFGYDGVNPYNKYYFEPINPAFTLFQSQEVSYGCGIAYDADDYKTIAASFEYGALVDEEFPSTKLELMGQYLFFFGIDNPIVSVDENNNSITENEISNYPNPFTDKTYITFGINDNSKVTLEIFNLKGQLIKKLIDNELKSGTHKIIWKGEDNKNKSVPSGVYFYKLKTNSYQKTGKLVYIE